MRIFAYGLFCVLLLSSCGYFSQKISETIMESNGLVEQQSDSLKKIIINSQATLQFDSAFARKMDTLYASGFRLADLMDSVKVNAEYNTAYGAQLYHFRNYVNHNFEYSDQIVTLMITLSAGQDMQSAQQPAALNAIGSVWLSMAKNNIMQIILLCRQQYEAT